MNHKSFTNPEPDRYYRRLLLIEDLLFLAILPVTVGGFLLDVRAGIAGFLTVVAAVCLVQCVHLRRYYREPVSAIEAQYGIRFVPVEDDQDGVQ